MRAHWLSVLLTFVTTTATAGPIGLADLRLVQLAEDPATTISTVLDVQGGPMATFYSTRTDFTLIADIRGWTPGPGRLEVDGPMGLTTWEYPWLEDAVAATVSIPRVYQPTVFHAQATLHGADGRVGPPVTVHWVASSPVPEPATWTLLVIGLLGVWLMGRRRVV